MLGGRSAFWGPLLKLTAEAWFWQPGILSIGWNPIVGNPGAPLALQIGFRLAPGPCETDRPVAIGLAFPRELSVVAQVSDCFSSQLHLLFPQPGDVSGPQPVHSPSALSTFSGLGPRGPQCPLLQTLPFLVHSQASLIFPAVLCGLTGTLTFPTSCSLRGTNISLAQPALVPRPSSPCSVEGTSAGLM